MPDPIDVAVGQRINNRRRALRMSQSTLAIALGVSFQQVQKYERGANRISASMLARTAATLKCKASDLMGESLANDLRGDALELATIFEKLGPKEAQAILQLARAMTVAGD